MSSSKDRLEAKRRRLAELRQKRSASNEVAGLSTSSLDGNDASKKEDTSKKEVPVNKKADESTDSQKPTTKPPSPSPPTDTESQAEPPKTPTCDDSIQLPDSDSTALESSRRPTRKASTSGISTRRELALKTAKINRLTNEIGTWKEKYDRAVQEDKDRSAALQKLEDELAIRDQELVQLKSEKATHISDEADKEQQSVVNELKKQLVDNATKSAVELKDCRDELRASLVRIDELKASVESVTQDANSKGEQLTQLGEMLLAAGAGLGEGISMELIMERFSEQQQQCADYEAMLEEKAAEIEELKGQQSRKDDNRGAIESVLDEYESQHVEMSKELDRLKAIEIEYKETKESRTRAVETWQAKAHETEAQLKQAQAAGRESAEEAASLRKQLNDAKARSRDAHKHRDDVTNELEAHEEKIEQLVLREKELGEELSRVIEQSHVETANLLEEVQVHKTIATATKVELEQVKHAAVADVEAVKIALNDQNMDLIEAKSKAKQAKEELVEMESSMNQVVKELKEEVIAATGNMEGAALAGLGLQEMIAKLKEDHAQAIEDLTTSLESSRTEFEKSQAELTDTSAQLDERNAMLTEVMNFMQQQQAEVSEDIPEGEEGGGLEAMMERSARIKESLENNLAEFEEENGRLNVQLSKTQSRLAEIEQAKRKVESELDLSTAARDRAVSELSEKSSMLDRIMGMVKKSGQVSESMDGYEEEEHNNDPMRGIASLEEQIRSLLDANRALEAEKDKLTVDLAQLHESASRLQELCNEQRDEMEVLSSKALQLADATAAGENLKKMLHEGELAKTKLREEMDKLRATIAGLEKERGDLQDELAQTKSELQTLRDELAQSLADAEAAAMGGLSLMDMLKKLKSDHEAEIEALEKKIAGLEGQLSDKDAAMARLAGLLPGDEENMADALATLELRLKRQMAEAESMMATIAEYESTIADKTAKIDTLNAKVESLHTKIRELEKKLADAIEELQNLNSGIQQAFTKAKKKPTGSSNEDDDDYENEPAPANISLDELLDSIETLTALLETREGELEVALERYAELNNLYSASTTKISQLEDELEMERETSAERQIMIERLTKRLDAMEERLAQMTKYRDELSEENRKLIEQLENMRKLAEKEGMQKAAVIADLEKRLQQRLARIKHLESKLLEKITELSATQAFLRKIALRTWEDDTRSEECTNCDEQFTLLVRRHHCRICGKVFCKSCSSYKVQTTAKRKPVRSCEDCFKYMELLSLHDQVSVDALAFEEKSIVIKKDVTRRSGFDFHITPEMPPLKGVIIIVTKVDPSGISAQSLTIGDKITTINGVSVRELSEKRAYQALQSPETLNLVVHTPTEGPDAGDGDDGSLDGEDGSDDEPTPLPSGTEPNTNPVNRRVSDGRLAQIGGSSQNSERASRVPQAKDANGTSNMKAKAVEDGDSAKKQQSAGAAPLIPNQRMPDFEDSVVDVQINLVPGRALGVSFGVINGALVTTKVPEGGLANETGQVKVGMKVVSINGQSTEGMTKKQCAEAIGSASETIDLGLSVPLEEWKPLHLGERRPLPKKAYKFENDIADGPVKKKPAALPLTLFSDDGEESELPDHNISKESDKPQKGSTAASSADDENSNIDRLKEAKDTVPKSRPDRLDHEKKTTTEKLDSKDSLPKSAVKKNSDHKDISKVISSKVSAPTDAKATSNGKGDLKNPVPKPSNNSVPPSKKISPADLFDDDSD